MTDDDRLLIERARRVLVCGGRDFRDRERCAESSSSSLRGRRSFTGVRRVPTRSSSAEAMRGGYAWRQGLREERHPAWWTAPCRAECAPNHRRKRADGSDYCPAAGNFRNQEMLETGVDVVIAFPGGRGTADMTGRARSADVPVVQA